MVVRDEDETLLAMKWLWLVIAFSFVAGCAQAAHTGAAPEGTPAPKWAGFKMVLQGDVWIVDDILEGVLLTKWEYFVATSSVGLQENP